MREPGAQAACRQYNHAAMTAQRPDIDRLALVVVQHIARQEQRRDTRDPDQAQPQGTVLSQQTTLCTALTD
jgi:hypothetical protein